jgi:hypothetical protein
MQMQGEGVYRDGEGLERHVVRSGCNLWPWVAIVSYDGLGRVYSPHGRVRDDNRESKFDLVEYLRPLPVTMQHPEVAQHVAIAERLETEYRELEGELHYVRGELQKVDRLLEEKRYQCQVQHEEILKLRKQVGYLNFNAMSAIQQLSAAMVAVTDKFPEGDSNGRQD